MLTARGEAILRSVVTQYIARAVPVPSQDLVSDGELAVSSATIRNEMTRLEEEGYILRPHPSAGSVPSDKGYRYYVGTLEGVRLPSSQQIMIRHLFHQVEGELEEWLSLAASLIARLAQNVAVVAMPRAESCCLKHMEVVALRESLALVIVVLHGARVRQQLLTFDKPVTQSRLTRMSNKFNAAYSGRTLGRVRARKGGLTPDEELLYRCLVRIMEGEDEQGRERSYLAGMQYTLNQPEFHHARPVLDLMELVDGRRLLMAITPADIGSQQVRVVIGEENRAKAIQNCSVVISQYGLPDEAVGVIGVLGPTRMPYARTISAVGYLSLVLTQLIAGLYGEKLSNLN